MNRKLDAAVAQGLGLKVRWGPGVYYDERGWTNRADVPGSFPEGSQPFMYDPELEWILVPFFASDLDAAWELDVEMGRRGWKLSLHPLGGDPVDWEPASGERPLADQPSGRRPEELLAQGRFEDLPDADGWIAAYQLSDRAGGPARSRTSDGSSTSEASAPSSNFTALGSSAVSNVSGSSVQGQTASTVPQAVSLAAYRALTGRDWVEIVRGE